MSILAIKSPFLKRLLKITGRSLLILLLLLLIAVALVRTEWAQNLLISEVTSKLSKQLHTNVSVKKISIGFFDRLNLEGTLIEDQHKDTLLYAGNVKMEITDWFFLKNEIELEYIGLENANIFISRKDSIWNYQFIIDAFVPSGPRDTTSKEVELLLKKVDLKNIHFTSEDEWVGQSYRGGIASLELNADEINFNKKKIFISSLVINKPYFSMTDFEGKMPKKDSSLTERQEKISDDNPWNSDEWDVLISRVSISEGVFHMDGNNRKAYDYFDPGHIEFSGITGTFTNLSILNDTMKAKIDLKTKERSGFTVNRLKADMTFHPKGMIFKNLDLQTPNSRLRNYYAMRYNNFNGDMSDYIDKVKMEAHFENSTLSSKDIAYFAPKLNKVNRTIQISGSASGTVSNITAKNIRIEHGKTAYLTGNLTLTGLPDIDKTLIDFNNGDLKFNYTDAIDFIPEIGKIDDPDLASLGYVRFKGRFKGYISDFVTVGAIETALGTMTADVNLKFPNGKPPSYAGIVNTNGFALGKFLKTTTLGNIAFNGSIRGTGFETNGAIELNGTVMTIEFNNYLYHNVSLNGKLQQKQFTGEAIVNDPNAKAVLNGFFNLNNPLQPELNVVAEIQRANLKAINFTSDEMSVLGKIKVNFLGKSVDDFIGEASLFDVALTKDDETYIFDTLHLYSMIVDNKKQIELKNSDVDIKLNGIFKLTELQGGIKNYLSKYYPTYFTKYKNVIKNQQYTLKAELRNIDQYLQLFNKKLSGFDNTTITSELNTDKDRFLVDINIPQASYGKYEFRDFAFHSEGNIDSLRVSSSAGRVTINDSLQFPSTAINILAAGDVSDINLTTSANQAINAANLSVRVTNLSDGIRIHFNPSSIVLNQKTWRVDKNGELTISKSIVDASEIRMTNGEQEILISSIPSEIGNTHDIIATLHRVNLGDILPFVMQEPQIQGRTSGEITVEDPLNKLKVYLNAQTEQTYFEDDSIGITSINGYWDNANKKANFNLISDNPHYDFKVNGNINIMDSSNQTMDINAAINDTRLSILKKYLSIVFSEMDGNAQGNLRLSGKLNAPDLTGTVRIMNAGVKIDYTQVYYKLNDPVITFKPGVLDIGEITLTDKYGYTGTVSGTLKHRLFRNMEYDFRASSKKLLVMNTNKLNNDIFFGTAVARMNFALKGPEEDMKMLVIGEPVDSSRMTIMTSGASKESEEVDYIVWRQYGREMNVDSLQRSRTNLSIDLDLTANTFLKMAVVLDEETGDSITASGDGSIKILTGTNETMVMNGRYNIAKGFYNFNFQQIFNKPFTLEQGSGSYLSWTGNPYDAEININATYLAEKVRISSLFDESNKSGVSSVGSEVMNEISDVIVKCNLSGTLSAPNPSFEIVIPPNSSVKNNPSVDNKIKTINRDQNEVSKQSTYLIVFKSFAPQAAIVSTDINQELINNTISGVINSILSNSVQNLFYKIFGSSLDVNFNYSRMASNYQGTTTTDPNSDNFRENVSLQFIKSMVNNRLIVSFGSDFNFSATGATAGSVSTQSFLFLPDVNVEYKITPDGRFRTSFFYRSSYDAMSTSGKRDRTGGNISYRTEFDYIFKARNRKMNPPVDSVGTDPGGKE